MKKPDFIQDGKEPPDFQTSERGKGGSIIYNKGKYFWKSPKTKGDICGWVRTEELDETE